MALALRRRRTSRTGHRPDHRVARRADRVKPGWEAPAWSFGWAAGRHRAVVVVLAAQAPMAWRRDRMAACAADRWQGRAEGPDVASGPRAPAGGVAARAGDGGVGRQPVRCRLCVRGGCGNETCVRRYGGIRVIGEMGLRLWISPICGRKVVSSGVRGARLEADLIARKAISQGMTVGPVNYFGAITTASMPGPTWAPIVAGVVRISRGESAGNRSCRRVANSSARTAEAR
jgi:hypothetical protein